jgi:hypothetical protein
MKSCVIFTIVGLAFAAPVIRWDIPTVKAAATVVAKAYTITNTAVETAKTAD